jgi:precorrin-8X/cobalt-precorrin-8 methylmutase
MPDYMQQPAAIAADSFALIRRELAAMGYHFAPPLDVVIERIIHSTADFEFAELTQVSPGAVEAGVKALQNGGAVITDVQMVRIGINSTRLTALGSAAHCFVADEVVRQRAEAAGLTRSALGMRLAAERGLLNGAIVAIGNAPTALYEIIRLIIAAGYRPALVIGVPVGFISTAESKAALVQLTEIPWIVTTGRKGGSTVAVAIVNALLRLAANAPAEAVD